MLDPVAFASRQCQRHSECAGGRRDAGVKRVVYASSSSLYGDSPTLPKHEGMMPNPLSPYGAQKLFGEMYCQVFRKLIGLKRCRCAISMFSVRGRIRRRNTAAFSRSSFPRYCRIASRRSTAMDCSRATSLMSRMSSKRILLACTAPGIAGEAFNVACGDRITVNSMLRRSTRSMGKMLRHIRTSASGRHPAFAGRRDEGSHDDGLPGEDEF